SVSLDYTLPQWALSPNEEVNVIQIIREALSNALHHSQADAVKILVTNQADNKVQIQVRDNGIGIQDDPRKTSHYGLTIMQDRSESLGGTVSVKRVEPSGTCVELEFTPQTCSELGS
ncbi:MAG: ATP-binding protein, partial [Halopseudomonas sp.]